jgi:hypothetical protein
MTLSMGKYCAETGFGVCGVAAVVMVIPGCAVFTGAFGTSDCSERRQRTATLIPDWLSFPTSLTLHAAGLACRGWFQCQVASGLAGGASASDEDGDCHLGSYRYRRTPLRGRKRCRHGAVPT